MKGKKEQKIFRLLPCYKHDVLAIEQWLEDMAAEGYMLKKFVLNGAVFVEQEPAQVRYRLLLAPENKLLSTESLSKQDNFIAKNGENGWAYITSYGLLFAFICRKTEIPEPERNLADTMDKMVRNDRIFKILALLVVISALADLWLHTGLGMLLCITIGTWKYAAIMISALYLMWDSISAHINLLKVRRAIENNTYAIQDDYSREMAQAKNKRRSIVWLASMMILIIGCTSAVIGLHNEQKEEPLESYYDTLPFPMMVGIVTDDSLQITENWQDSTIRQWEDILAPVAIEATLYRDCVDVEAGKYVKTGFMQITYFETQTSWMAEQLAKDYQRFDNASRFGIKSKGTIMQLPELNMDYAVAYAYKSWRNTIILAEGKKMMRICFYGYDSTVGEIAQIYADYLLSE